MLDVGAECFQYQAFHVHVLHVLGGTVKQKRSKTRCACISFPRLKQCDIFGKGVK